MASLWPWLVVAGLGALHGLNPLNGWLLVAAWGLRSHGKGREQVQALLPIAAGHAASVALVAVAVAYGLVIDGAALQLLAGALLAGAGILHLSRHSPQALRAPAGHAGLALWSFLASSAHGAGLLLVPALAPLCLGGGGADLTEALILSLAAVGVHAAAMLAAIGVVALGARRSFEAAGARFGQIRRTQPLD